MLLEGGGARPTTRTARDPDLTETSLRAWIRQVAIDEGNGTGYGQLTVTSTKLVWVLPALSTTLA